LGKGEVSAESIGKTAFSGAARPRRAELASCGTVGTALHSRSGSNLRLRTAWSWCDAESNSKMEIPDKDESVNRRWDSDLRKAGLK
jgi:hypothetical protein